MKLNKLFLLVCSSALLLLSCSREIEPQYPDGVYPSMTLFAVQPEAKSYMGSVQGDGSVPIYWNATDELWVRSAAQEAGTPGNKFTTSSSDLSDGGLCARFRGNAPADGPYVAVYPYQLVDSSSDNNTIVVKVPQSQDYAQKSFGDQSNFTAAVWSSGNEVFLRNLAGAIRFSFKGTKSVKKIILSDNDPSVALWGDCTLTVDYSSETISSVVWSNTASNRNQLTLTCESAVKLGTSITEFIFVVPVGAFAKGFTCTLYDASNKVIKTIGTDNPCTVERSKIVNMKEITPENQLFSGGDGSQAKPYRIATPDDLVLLANSVNGSSSSSYNTKYYRQIRDINMKDVAINCIGNTSSLAFKGNYDGGGYSITSLKPTCASSAAAGMFGYLSSATVKNVVVDGYTNTGTTGEQGVIAGRSTSSTISNCTVRVGTVKFKQCATGGVVGYMSGGSVSNCTVTGFFHNENTATFNSVSGCTVIGGVAGYITGATIQNCSFRGNVTGRGEEVGGIVGSMTSSNVKNCSVLEGSGICTYNYYVGGIAGQMLSGNISGCSVQSGISAYFPGAGGIVGWLKNGNVTDCVVGSYTTVRSSQDKGGGIAGYIYSTDAQSVTISGCTVYGNVTAAYSVGGLAGEVNPNVDSSVINFVNCAYIGGEIFSCGFLITSSDSWAMVGGLVGWARFKSTSATINFINCFADAQAIRADFTEPLKLSIGGLIGEQGGSSANCKLQGCYTTFTNGRLVVNGSTAPSSSYTNYGAVAGTATKFTMDHVYYPNGLSVCGTSATITKTECAAYTVYKMVNNTMRDRLNEFRTAYTGSFTLKKWVAGNDGGYPLFDGIIANPTIGKRKPLRVSIIGDSLSTFQGYCPHGYHESRAPSGYRCHYPTSDGNVTSVTQTYWYRLTYDYLQNAVWDTNLAFSGTATTRCTDTSKSSNYWYGEDFCTRYIQNGGLGSPDIVIINGGANDWAHGIYNLLGSQKLTRYPSTTPHRPSDSAMNAAYAVADACTTLAQAKALPDATFIEAYLKLVRMITLQYPHCKIVVLIHDTLTPDVEESLIHIANHYENCRYVDLYAVNGFNDLGWNFEYLDKGYQPNMPKHDFDWENIKTDDKRKNCNDHYADKAMKFIANKIYTELGTWLESSSTYADEAGGFINNFDNANGAW